MRERKREKIQNITGRRRRELEKKFQTRRKRWFCRGESMLRKMQMLF